MISRNRRKKLRKNGYLAISRVDNESKICPVCGVAEAVVVLSEEEQKQIIADVERAEIENGRVKPL